MSDAKPPQVIHFYSTTGDHGCFSNFSKPSVFLKGKRWPTSEHYFLRLEQTGCRPFGEAARIKPEMIDWKEGTVTFTRHKNARKGKPRVVYLTPKARDVLSERAGKRRANWSSTRATVFSSAARIPSSASAGWRG